MREKGGGPAPDRAAEENRPATDSTTSATQRVSASNGTRFGSLEDFLDYLTDREADGLPQIVKPSGAGFQVRCPAHHDDTPSLSVAEGDQGDRIVICCHVGCTAEQITAALDLSMADLFYGSRTWGVSSRPWSLEEVHATFREYLGSSYDLQVLDTVLAVAAGQNLPGDPAWLQVVGGPGSAKTETVNPLQAVGAVVVSSISSEGALLSGTAKREVVKGATGGLLREVGEDGVLVVKDFTTILSMGRDDRAKVLAALREVYDGAWVRKIGVDGGRSLTWRGRLILIGAVTTAWDMAYSVVASMGDRFLLVRMDSREGRSAAARQAIHNSGGERKMRRDLAVAVHGLLNNIDVEKLKEPPRRMVEDLVAIADLVTLARTAVERDFKGNAVDVHAPESPTRLVKQLTMLYRGARLIGLDHRGAADLVLRVAHDTIPPLRLDVLLDVEKHAGTTTHAVSVRLNRPRRTVDQALQVLQVLDLVSTTTHEEPVKDQVKGVVTGKRNVWHYSVTSLVSKRVCRFLRVPHKKGGSVTPSGDMDEVVGKDVGHAGGNTSPLSLEEAAKPPLGSEIAVELESKVQAVMAFWDGTGDPNPLRFSCEPDAIEAFIAEAERWHGFTPEDVSRAVDGCPYCDTTNRGLVLVPALAVTDSNVFLYVCDCGVAWRCHANPLIYWEAA